jgi:hypothetical protein
LRAKACFAAAATATGRTARTVINKAFSCKLAKGFVNIT